MSSKKASQHMVVFGLSGCARHKPLLLNPMASFDRPAPRTRSTGARQNPRPSDGVKGSYTEMLGKHRAQGYTMDKLGALI